MRAQAAQADHLSIGSNQQVFRTSKQQALKTSTSSTVVLSRRLSRIGHVTRGGDLQKGDRPAGKGGGGAQKRTCIILRDVQAVNHVYRCALLNAAKLHEVQLERVIRHLARRAVFQPLAVQIDDFRVFACHAQAAQGYRFANVFERMGYDVPPIVWLPHWLSEAWRHLENATVNVGELG